MSALKASPSSVKFYYDIVCPFAYMASTLIGEMAERTGATVNWTPVLLGRMASFSSPELSLANPANT